MQWWPHLARRWQPPCCWCWSWLRQPLAALGPRMMPTSPASQVGAMHCGAMGPALSCLHGCSWSGQPGGQGVAFPAGAAGWGHGPRCMCGWRVSPAAGPGNASPAGREGCCLLTACAPACPLCNGGLRWPRERGPRDLDRPLGETSTLVLTATWMGGLPGIRPAHPAHPADLGSLGTHPASYGCIIILSSGLIPPPPPPPPGRQLQMGRCREGAARCMGCQVASPSYTWYTAGTAPAILYWM